ncbi:hypothetical protein RhiirC2_703192 [Rhizophagus irregularis]|uniref:Transposase domain-containing protein n=3 Tax=Rhizophagus irregularis TaxID=588596 RepID=A0A2N1MEG1_9GLOM|nr:hypothetical protein RhiirC2_703192 [Rhizophagus irregularis]
MQYFCSCRICKINPGGGKWLSTKKTFKKHQEKEKACIEKINESETESSSESISSYNVAEKRKFDELDKSDINSVNSLSDNESLDNEDDNNNPSQEDYNGDNDNPSQDYNNYNENYNGDNDNSSLDEDNGNNNNPNQDYDCDDNPSLDNDENDKVEDMETESDVSEENDEFTEMDNKFNDIEDINDDELIKGLRLLHTKVLHSISDIAFNKILDNINSNLTIYKLKKKINNIIPFKPQKYDTCKNSCIAFTSLYENLTTCPICNENRFDDNSKPVNTTFFFSLKERLIIQYKDKERAEELQYRNTYFQTKGENGENEKMYADIFDGM